MLTCPQHATASPTRCPQPPWSANSPSAARSETPPHLPSGIRLSIRSHFLKASSARNCPAITDAFPSCPRRLPLPDARARYHNLWRFRAKKSPSCFSFSHPHFCPEHTQHCPPYQGSSPLQMEMMEGLFFFFFNSYMFCALQSRACMTGRLCFFRFSFSWCDGERRGVRMA